ncbi:hypothetical protein [Thiohalophilus thiocyanatoxydans]|uniref:hypothetical protein n=1 Tax=Thiohalophilus thiocyanatoxydans TaxID=381308 RepID=UPI001416EE53|nr:hypothetical protein [Thiohalophilus thiocyanatoxydans]
MDSHTVAPAGVLQAFKVKLIVLFGIESDVAVVPALDDLTGHSGQIHTGYSGHSKLLLHCGHGVLP